MTVTPPRDTTLVKPLTSIRFFAAMSVVVFHSGASFVGGNAHVPGPVKTLLVNGYLGVTFFFVLSGFILHYTYQGRVVGAAKLKGYGVARFARIYPIYLLAVLAAIPFVPMNGWGDVPQFLLLQWWPPGGAVPWYTWNMPTWTLSVEFFFYLCFPLLSAAVRRIGTRGLVAIVIALLAFDAATASSALIDSTTVMWPWMRWVPVPLLRLPEFAVGICAAELHLRRAGGKLPFPSWLPAVALVAGLAVNATPWIAAYATTMTVLLISAVAADRDSRFARALSWRWLVLLGSASYALYLFQIPVHLGVVALLGSSKAMIALQFPILLIVSLLLFLFVEEPAREWIRARMGMKPSAIEPVAAGASA